LLAIENGHCNFSQPLFSWAFVSSMVFQTFDRMMLGRLSFPETKLYAARRRQHGTHK